MSSSRDIVKVKTYLLWWIVFLMRNYLKAGILNKRIKTVLSLTKNQREIINGLSKLSNKKKDVEFTGFMKDARDTKFQISFEGMKIYNIPVWKRIFSRIVFFKRAILVRQIYIDNEPVIKGWNKIKYPNNFMR